MQHGRRIGILLILLIIGCPSPVAARGGIVVVQSISIPPYERAVEGFTGACSTLPLNRIVLADSHSLPLVERIRRNDPDLVLAVGLDALRALGAITDIPIVYVMLMCPECEMSGRKNVTGINMSPSVEVQLLKIKEVLPGVQQIGVLYDPDQTGSFVQKAKAAAQSMDMEILSRPIRSPREVPSGLVSLRDNVGLVWMIPDITVITSQTLEIFILFSMENRMPLAAFSEKYLELGAFMAFGLDAADMGRQAGEMANTILSGVSPEMVPVQDARTVSVTVNGTMAGKFGIGLNADLKNQVIIVE